MPNGLLLLRWDERSGVEITAKYPEVLELNEMTMMQVYSQHEYSQDAGTISLTVGPVNIISYYSGPKKGYYILLILDASEDPDDFESILIDIAHIILQNIREEQYIPLIPILFIKASLYPDLPEELELLFFYKNEIYNLILNRLRDECIADKVELKAWLNDKYRRSFIDTEAIINEFIKYGFIKESSMRGKGLPSLLLYFINDILVYRIPPLSILKDSVNAGLPFESTKIYSKDVSEFFSKYIPTEEDNKDLLNIFTIPIAYEILTILRKEVLSKTELYNRLDYDEEDITQIIDALEKVEILKIIKKNEDTEYFILLSDITIEKFFPKYVFNSIVTDYNQNAKAHQVLHEYLKILEDEYSMLKKQAQ